MAARAVACPESRPCQYGDPAAGTTASVSVTDYAGSPESAASLAAFALSPGF